MPHVYTIYSNLMLKRNVKYPISLFFKIQVKVTLLTIYGMQFYFLKYMPVYILIS